MSGRLPDSRSSGEMGVELDLRLRSRIRTRDQGLEDMNTVSSVLVVHDQGENTSQLTNNPSLGCDMREAFLEHSLRLNFRKQSRC